MLPASSTYISFKYRQHQIKNGISDDELVLLKIPVSLEEHPTKDFKRIHAKEFQYKGNMYDVVKQKSKGDTTWYWCIWDKRETALLANLDKLVHRAMSHNSAQQDNIEMLKKLLSSLYFTKYTIQLALPVAQKSKTTVHIAEHTISSIASPPTPPPQVQIL